MPSSDTPRSGYPAGLGRRLGAALYDALLVLGLWMMTLFVWIAAGEGEPVTGWLVQMVLLFEWAAFYAYAWSHGGQTLGMRAWHIYLFDVHGKPPGGRHIAVRLLTAPLSVLSCGLGYLWLYVGDRRQTWHDRLSDTLVVHVPKDG